MAPGPPPGRLSPFQVANFRTSETSRQFQAPNSRRFLLASRAISQRPLQAIFISQGAISS